MPQAAAVSQAVTGAVTEQPKKQELFTAIKAEVEDKLANYQRINVYDLKKEQLELRQRWEALGQITDEQEREAEQRVIEAENLKLIESLEAMSRDQVESAIGLEALLKDLGVFTEKQKELTDEDKALITAAEKARDDANEAFVLLEQRVGQARPSRDAAQLQLDEAEEELGAANRKWFGKRAAVADAERKVRLARTERDQAQAVLDSAPQAIADAKDAIVEAEQGIVEAKAEVERNVAERVRKATLSESYEMLREMAEQTVNLFVEDANRAEEVLTEERTALKAMMGSRTEKLKERQRLEGEVKNDEELLAMLDDELKGILDTESPEYGDKQKEIIELERKLAGLQSELQLVANASHSLNISISVTQQNVRGLQTNVDTSRMYAQKIRYTEQTARVLAAGVDQMVKHTRVAAAGDVVDRAGDQLIFKSVSMSNEARVASQRKQNAALARYRDQMNRLMSQDRVTTDTMAQAKDEYRQVAEEIRQRHAARGIDMDDARLEALAAEILPAEEEGASEAASGGMSW